MTNENNNKSELIIFDTDLGTDDAWALFMLLKGEKYNNFKIIAITLVHGNSTLHNVGNNTLRVLEIADRTDIPVYEGAHEALIQISHKKDKLFHGNDGFGDLENVSMPQRNLIRSENGINALYRIVKENPKKVTIICVGPLTNIALALKTYSDFGENVKEIHVMGGNYNAVGNTTRCAEFNFFTDPEAAFIVFNTAKCPLVLLPWEACTPDNLEISMDWRFSVLGRMESDMVKLLNSAEKSIYLPGGFETWNPCDALLTAAFINPHKTIRKSRRCHATIELAGTHTRGQVVIDHLKENGENVTIIELLHTEMCKNLLLWTADHPNINL